MSTSSEDSSSSGEEVNPSDFEEDGEVEEDNVTEKSENDAAQHKPTWRNDDIRKLANGIFTQISSDDVLLPYDTVSVNWEEVGAEMGINGRECEVKWHSLLNSIRTYRTMPEVIGDVLTLCSKMSIAKHNKEIEKVKKLDIVKPKKVVKKSTRTVGTATANGAIKSHVKKPVNPDHPKRPFASGYLKFSSECNITEKGVQKMLKLGAMWKGLTEAQRKKYNDDVVRSKERYFQKLQSYAAKHPEDLEIQQILAEETKHRRNKLKKKEGEKELANKSNSSSLISGNSTLDDTLVSTESDTATPMKSPKKSPKKRHQEDSFTEEVESPTKKKKKAKKAEKVVTGEDIFVQKKFDSYKEDHSDMEDDDIKEKLRKKYHKLSEEKKARYTQKAEENNT